MFAVKTNKKNLTFQKMNALLVEGAHACFSVFCSIESAAGFFSTPKPFQRTLLPSEQSVGTLALDIAGVDTSQGRLGVQFA